MSEVQYILVSSITGLFCVWEGREHQIVLDFKHAVPQMGLNPYL